MVVKCKLFVTAIYTSETLALCIGTHVCTISNVIGINEKKTENKFVCQTKKSCDYRCKRANMIAKYKLFVTAT